MAAVTDTHKHFDFWHLEGVVSSFLYTYNKPTNNLISY